MKKSKTEKYVKKTLEQKDKHKKHLTDKELKKITKALINLGYEKWYKEKTENGNTHDK